MAACKNSLSTARLFLQITSRRPPSSSPVLDVLLPPPAAAASRLLFSTHASCCQSAAGLSVVAHCSRHSRRSRFPCDSPVHAFAKPRLAASRAPIAAFSGTPARRQTRALYNPQKDDDGNEMLLEITPRAAKRLSDIMSKDGNPYLALRIQVESGGCHGFQYLMRLVTLPSSLPAPGAPAPAETSAETSSETAIGEDDTIFTFAGDEGSDSLTSPKIILDGPSLELLKGSKVDFTMELIGSQFKIVDNPLATSSCGCGTSFDIKM